MRQEHELVRRMKADEVADRPPFLEQIAQPAIGDHALDEILTHPRIAEASLLLDRQVREAGEQRLREEADADPPTRLLASVDLDAVHAAAGRVLLQDVAAEILDGELR